jgi:hypothetical protein
MIFLKEGKMTKNITDNIADIISGLGYTGYGGGFLPYRDFDAARYLKKHDVVFKSPQQGGYEGLPLGNGDIGLMQWTVEDGLRFAINKNDVWTQPDGEAPMLQRSCGRLDISFNRPLNDFLYIDDFETRLSIAEAKTYYKSKTPFFRAEVAASVDTGSNLAVIDIACEDAEGDGKLRISIDRYGSRAFRSWYHGIRRGAGIGLGSAESAVCGDIIYIYEPFNGGKDVPCAIAALLAPERPAANPEIRIINSRRADIVFNYGRKAKMKLLIAAESGYDGADPVEKAVATINNARNGLAEKEERRAKWWRDYWNRSFLHLEVKGKESEYDYLENLYYIQFYALACASRGEYPMLFNGGLFNWNRDVRNWVNPHHWNMQQPYWAVEAANRPELAEPYIKTYTRIMPEAKAFAREKKNVQNGIVISEMHDYAGRMLNYLGALTPASQIAMQFWNHYIYSPDDAALRETVYPFIRECADFYAEYAKWDGSRGVFVIAPAAPCECAEGENFTNTVVDLTMVRYILPKAIFLAAKLNTDGDRAEKWKTLLRGVSDYRYLGSADGEVLAVVEDGDGFPDGGKTFCRNISPLVPCPILTYRDKGTRLYRAVLNALKGYTRMNLAINPGAVAWTRAGDGNRAAELLFNSAEQLQHFRQGFFYNIDHWYWYSRYWERVDDYFTECQRDYIHDKSLEYGGVNVYNGAEGEKTDLPMEPFVQPGFETPGILTSALHEMLLQSYEGLIRLAPALPEGLSGIFTLKAAGGFMVSACVKDGKVIPAVTVKSMYGGECKISIPFEDRIIKILTLPDYKSISYTTDEGVVFDTEINFTYLLIASDARAEELAFDMPGYAENNDEKRYLKAALGRKRMY